MKIEKTTFHRVVPNTKVTAPKLQPKVTLTRIMSNKPMSKKDSEHGHSDQ